MRLFGEKGRVWKGWKCMGIERKDRESEKLKRKGGIPVLQRHRMGETEYLVFPGLEGTGMVRHLFSTRIGGVSRGIYASMNLSYSRGDEREAVDENFRRIAAVFDSTPDHIVCSDQTHTTNIRRVTSGDAGKGVTREKDYTDVDGLITDDQGLILATFYADCVPIFLADPDKRAIGLFHSGWKGTAGRMGERAIIAMREAFGTHPEHVKAAIGPSICQDCYEVGNEVASVFAGLFGSDSHLILKPGKEEGKYQLSLWEANRRILLEAGVLPENLEVTDLCTCCNSGYLFSHRASRGRRGNLGAFMELIKS